MTSEILKVNIADMKVGRGDTVITTTSLGSCIAVIIYDPVRKIGGLAHIMHSNSPKGKKVFNPAKYVDTAINEMLREILKKGGVQDRLKAYIIGGACMFPTLETDPETSIGKNNVEKARKILRKESIRLVGRDTGGDYGRSVEFVVSTGEVLVKSVKHGLKNIGAFYRNEGSNGGTI